MLPLLYPVLLFVHIVAALVLFTSEGVVSFTVRELRAAQDAETVRLGMVRLRLIERFSTPAPPLLLLSGLGLCTLVWGFRIPWVDLSLTGFIAIAVLIRTVDYPRLKRIRERMAASADFRAEIQPVLLEPALRRSGRLRFSLLLWLVLLMTVKPALLAALGALLVALIWAMFSPLHIPPAVTTPLM